MCKCILKASLDCSMVCRPMIHTNRHFCLITNWSDCRSQFRSNHMTWVILSFLIASFSFLMFKCSFKNPLNGFYDLEPMIHVICIFLPNIKLEELLITVLTLAREFSKPNNICRVKFHCYCPHVFPKLFWMFCWFRHLWYTLPSVFTKYQTAAIADHYFETITWP